MGKYLDYIGEQFEAQKIFNLHLEKACSSHNKLNAKIRFLNVLSLKHGLVFHHCKKEAEKFYDEYNTQHESYSWKYLYRTEIIIAKLYQMLNSLEFSMKHMERA